MENVTTKDSSVAGKASSNSGDGKNVAVSLGLNLQNRELYTSRNINMMGRHHHDHHRPSTGTGDGGPTPNYCIGNEVDVDVRGPMNIYNDGAPPPAGGSVVVRTLQPFDLSTNTSFRSAGGMAPATSPEFPFTWAQWKELERQAMVYKYIMASLPVPPDLLLPFARNSCAGPSPPISNSASIYNLGYASNKDPEPGRCKRTDGKKWRCSRDVAPHQKYCERHMQRGRPRSRKPVEVHHRNDNHAPLGSKKKTRLQHHGPLASTPVGVSECVTKASSLPRLGSISQLNGSSLFLNAKKICTSSYQEPKRGFGWMMEGGMVEVDGTEGQWHTCEGSNVNVVTESSTYISNTSAFDQNYVEQPLNLFSYATEFATSKDVLKHNADFNLFDNSDLVSLANQPQTGTPRAFIDAWSNDKLCQNDISTSNIESAMSSSQGNLSPSSLNLSMAMAAGHVVDKEMGQIRLSNSATGDNDNTRPNCPVWGSTVSWVNFPPGGPLAEVLQLNSVKVGGDSNPASPYRSNGDQISPPASTVSSPSGVLQRTLFSQSDASVCNSPIVAAPSTTPEVVAFQWLT